MVADNVAVATRELHSVSWQTAGPLLWAGLHRWALTAELSDVTRYLEDLDAKIGCGECRGHWRRWVDQNAPDAASHESLFSWTVKAHNAVSRRLGRGEMALADAMRRWTFDHRIDTPAAGPRRGDRRAVTVSRQSIVPVNCAHALDRPTPAHVNCGAGRFGGTPHVAVCNDCPGRIPKAFDAAPLGIMISGVSQSEPRPALSSRELRNYFDRVVVLNLKRRPDRMVGFTTMLESVEWPFSTPDRFDAVDGAKVPTPPGWHSGGGAWGCMQSHRHILERAIMDGVESLLVMEDDACCRSDFAKRVAKFLANVPDDWEQLMLGGQHIGNNGVTVAPGIVRCLNCQRTHAYAVRGKFMRDLYALWCSPASAVHCDHLMGPFQQKRKVYAPDPFLFGQERTKSDINGALNPRKFWQPPPREMPVILLHAPRDVMEAVRQKGFHVGFDRHPVTGIDSGLREIYSEERSRDERVGRLTHWINQLNWESASYENTFTTVWHPAARLEELVAASRGPVHEVHAASPEEALAALPAGAPRSHSERAALVVCLHANREVVAELRQRGWHTGYWRDDETDIDHGLLDIFKEPRAEEDVIDRLRQWIYDLQAEADTIPGGVLAIWHASATPTLITKATRLRVLEITAATDAIAVQALANARALRLAPAEEDAK